MGALFSRIHDVLTGETSSDLPPTIGGSDPISVRILAESNPNAIRKVAVEVYLPPVLSNIVLHYFSERSSMTTCERIYNRNETSGLKEVWELGGEHPNFSCSLSKTVRTENGPIHTQLWTSAETQADGTTDLKVQFSENQNDTTELLFCFVYPVCYNPEGISSHAFTLYCFTRYASDHNVPFDNYLKFLDDGIMQFQHSALLNVKSLIEAHKDHPYLLGKLCARRLR